ncbi:MAG: SdpI family protein [Candidatus Altiarchaeales archaeon]|nr:SdpI family protein [Candidatus Altiarchaeales archaeon]
MNKKDPISIALILAMLGIAAYIYPSMPDSIATHWNAVGEVDAYSSKAVGLFAIPALTAVVYLLFLAIPKIDVFKDNIMSFIGYYDNFKLLFVAFMLIVYSSTILQNMGYKFGLNTVLIPAVAVLFYYLGHIMPHMRRNFFIGIRTPWTLANEKVWNKVHNIGGKTFRLNAAVILLSLAVPSYSIWVLLASILLNALYLIAYSYLLYQKEGRNELQ